MKKLIITIALLTVLSIQPLNAMEQNPFAIMTSFVSSGDMAGGLRYRLDKNWAIDGWVSNSSSDTQNAQFWASLGFNEFGLTLSNNQSNELSTALGYSIERKFTNDISLGTGLKLVEFSNSETKYLGGWDAYIILSI